MELVLGIINFLSIIVSIGLIIVMVYEIKEGVDIFTVGDRASLLAILLVLMIVRLIFEVAIQGKYEVTTFILVLCIVTLVLNIRDFFNEVIEDGISIALGTNLFGDDDEKNDEKDDKKDDEKTNKN